MSKIKLCGMFREEDIVFVNEAKPDYCGFIINFPKSHRNLTPAQVRRLRAGLAQDIIPVGVFVDRPAEEIAAMLKDGTIRAAQLHGHENDAYIARLRSLVPDAVIWKAFRVRDPADLAAASASAADLVLLDNGYGTGQPFDWQLVREIGRPFLLAGGLNPDSIPEAIRQLRPWGVDLSSGVETNRMKDREKMIAAVRAAREA